MSERPDICRKRGCYIKPKGLFPHWDSLQIQCDECPYGPPLVEKRIEAAALAIATRRGLERVNREHPVWQYFLDDAKAALKAAEE